MLRHCMIVDDDIVCRKIASRCLNELLSSPLEEPNSHSIHLSNDGLSAFEHLQKSTKYQLVITDFSMPFMNGLQLSKNVRLLHPTTPIAMITSDDLDVDTLKHLDEIGLLGVWKKPITFLTMMEIVCRWNAECEKRSIS